MEAVVSYIASCFHVTVWFQLSCFTTHSVVSEKCRAFDHLHKVRDLSLDSSWPAQSLALVHIAVCIPAHAPQLYVPAANFWQ